MNNRTKILIIEDEPQMQRFLQVLLQGHGYQIELIGGAKEGLMKAAEWQPEVILVDLGLPDMDGLSLISRLREWTRVPLIVISARDQENDKVKALDNGADDYLTKPFGSSELLARIRVALRRNDHHIEPYQVCFESDKLTINFAQRFVWRNGKQIHLTPTEYKILHLLATNHGKVMTYRQILKSVWGAKYIEQNHYVRVHMAQMRHKLEEDPARPRYLLTENGIGYRFQFEEFTLENTTNNFSA